MKTKKTVFHFDINYLLIWPGICIYPKQVVLTGPISWSPGWNHNAYKNVAIALHSTVKENTDGVRQVQVNTNTSGTMGSKLYFNMQYIILYFTQGNL